MAKRFYGVGFNGQIQVIACTAEEASKVFKSTPVLEIFPTHHSEEVPHTFVDGMEHAQEMEFIGEFISQWYSRAVHGPYGDIIQVTCYQVSATGNMYTIDFIAHRAFHKPGTAADIVPFVHDVDGRVYLIGIIRGKNPGKGKFALTGGFIDIVGFHKETAAECAAREAGEEIGLSITCAPEYYERFVKIPYVSFVKVKAEFCGLSVATILQYVRTFETADNEQLPEFGLKRVSETSAYMLTLPVECALTAQEAALMFTAGDDADEIVAVPLSDILNQEFAFEHHRDICREAQEMLIVR